MKRNGKSLFFYQPDGLFTQELRKCRVRVVDGGTTLGNFDTEIRAKQFVKALGRGTVEPLKKAG